MQKNSHGFRLGIRGSFFIPSGARGDAVFCGMLLRGKLFGEKERSFAAARIFAKRKVRFSPTPPSKAFEQVFEVV